jgi:hypothetical protein
LQQHFNRLNVQRSNMKRLWGIAALVGALLGNTAQAQNAYPPSNILKVGSQLTFELRQQWTGVVSGKDSDGDWQGNARAANGTQGVFFGFVVQGGSNYAFQVGTTASSEYCILTPNSVSSNSGGVVVYSGSRFSQQGNANPINDNTTCQVTLNNGTGVVTQPVQSPVQPIQPPSLPGGTTTQVSQAQLPPLTFPPRLEVGQRWEFRLGNRPIVYRSALLAQENRNGTIVYTGTLMTDGTGDPIASRKLEVFFAQDTLAVYATDPQGGVTVCSFQGAASLQNNVLTGVVFYRAPGQQQFTTLTGASDAPCRANLEPIQSTVIQPTNPTQPSNPIQPPPQTQTLTPSVPAQVGDTWRIVANGNIGLEPWTLQFTKSDQDGVTGSSIQGAGRGDVSAFKTDNGGYAFLMNVNNRLIGCLLVPNTPVTGGALLGQLVEVVQVSGQNQARSLNTSCTATLTTRSGTSFIAQPTPTLTASLPVQVGDTWQISASGYQPWILQFSKLDDGDPAGTVTQGNARGETFAVKGTDGSHAFLIGIGGRSFYCFIQPNTRFQGSSILGGLGEFIGTGNNAQAQSLNTPCTATLTARSGNTGSTQPTSPILTASFPPKPGQTWTLTIDGLAPWTMVFDKTNQDGVSGKATQNGVSGNTFAFVDGGENWFQVSGGNLVYFCIFPARPQISGSSLVGGQAFSAPNPNAQLTRLNRACTATLNSQTLMWLYKTKLEREKMPIKLLPLF